ncbi:iron-siderophore ABC transporter substrate-binding protein [Spelaeicoccus albus]|uniref:Iron complex transport system substrate-binding protein n=1 Tax=Spelaeicoccus albus TaxID=1280376 RepID=A0A7Z0D3I8_9MICO|nr:iron-siderophore ABC transporter substrate-binding protein [Spelaeicoccus albus]NYI68216.1 iron complex transport system substrate-binding protein [Spelaeicoccus albus]
MTNIRPAAPTRRQFGVGAAIAGAALLAGCSSSPGTGGSTPTTSSGAFPVTIPNTFGKTTLKARPGRIVTLGYNAQDVVYALGRTPVGMPKSVYGADKNGLMPWDAHLFNASKTTLLDTADGPPFEQILKLEPDVILAPYEGFDKSTYERLTQIAPTVAYPDKAWQTSWQDQTTIVGKALGMLPQAKKLIRGVEHQLDAAAKKHPEFAGKTLTVAAFNKANVSIYTVSDPRVQILDELGFTNAKAVRRMSKTTDQFYANVSWEKVRRFDADVVIGYLGDMSAKDFTSDKVAGSLKSVKDGTAVVLSDTTVIAGLSQPSVLSVKWTLKRILPDLAKAAKR